MPVYTVHGPAATDAGLAATDKFAFVRDGFHVWAMLLGPIWLIWHRLWLALVGYLAATTVIDFVIARLHAGRGAMFFADVLIALLLGFEGASLRRWTLSRRNFRQLDIVVADDEEAAERRFFDRWTARQQGLVSDHGSVDRGAPPPTRHVPPLPFSKPPTEDGVIGLFPQPGASR